MSDHNVYVYKISIKECPNSDNLLIANPIGTDWQCLVRKDEGWQEGDLGAYIPIDTKMKPTPEFNFLEVRHWRIRTIKLRGQISQGLVVKAREGWKLGQDVSKELGVTRYEKPEEGQFRTMERGTWWTRLKKKIRKFFGLGNNEPDWFMDHTDIENIKNHPFVFKPEDEVVVTEKVDGTNWRIGLDDGRFGSKFLVGSHFTNKSLKSDVIYVTMAKLLDMENKCRKIFKGHRVVIFGEIYGLGIPNGCRKLWYGTKEPKAILFDIKLDGKWLDWAQVEEYSVALGLEHAHVIYSGLYGLDGVGLEGVKACVKGPTTNWHGPDNDKGRHIREGLVMRSAKDEKYNGLPGGRKWLKIINPEYLLLKGKQEEQEEKDGEAKEAQAQGTQVDQSGVPSVQATQGSEVQGPGTVSDDAGKTSSGS